MRIQSLEVRSSEDLDYAFQMANKQRAEGLIVVSFGGLLVNHQQRVVNLATNISVAGYVLPFPKFVEAGGLMSYAPDGPDRVRRAASYVDKILKGPSLPICPCSSR